MLGRFAQADSIVPGGIQGLDRYAYVNNSPVRYTDPTGHKCVGDTKECEDENGKQMNGAGERTWENPTDPMTQGDGWGWDSTHHPGMDVNTPDGNSQIVASTYGTVVSSTACTLNPCLNLPEGSDSASVNKGYGNVVIIAYEWDSLPPEIQASLMEAYPGIEGSTIYILYAHLDKPSSLQEGDRVAPGQLIGYEGSSGASTGPHLHLEIRYGEALPIGEFHDPNIYGQTDFTETSSGWFNLPIANPHYFFIFN